MKQLWICSCGQVPYKTSLEWQKKVVDQKSKDATLPDVVLLLEHPPVITIGKHGDPANILISSQQCQQKKIEVFPIGRGGDVTFHGPGQIVGYPLIDLRNFDKSIRIFVTQLEQVFISLLLKYYHISAERIEGYTGVWVNNQKITAMGLSVHRYITMHGFAFNVSTDLQYFRLITPCGISDKGVTTLEKETNLKISIESCIQQIGSEIGITFQKQIEWKSIENVLEFFKIS